MNFSIKTLKIFFENIIFLPKNINAFFFFYKIRNNTKELEKSLDFQLIILGKTCFAEIVTDIFDRSKISSLLEQEVDINKQLEKAKNDFTTKHIDNLTKEEHLEEQLKGENDLMIEFVKKLDVVKKDIKKLKKKLAQLKLTMAKNEMRKEKAKQLKTFIPMHLIDQKLDSLARKFKENDRLLQSKLQVYENLFTRIKNNNKQLDILKYEYKTISKKNKTLRNTHKQFLNDLKHQRNKVTQNLDSEFLELGLLVFELKDSDLTIQNDENCKYIAILKEQIYSNEEKYEKYKLQIPKIRKDITYALLFYMIVFAFLIIGIFGF